MRFTVLASGSGGNASLVESDGFGVLIDVGLGPRQLNTRLAAAGLSWSAVHAVLLTHTHSDHWKDATLLHLRRHNISLWCHASHHTVLRTYSDGFIALHDADLVVLSSRIRISSCHRDCVAGACRCVTMAATFGFRLEGSADLFGQCGAIGYAADLGCWDDELAGHLADVDLLAVEFNHDVMMQHASNRSPRLIERVLGDEGHLSNVQAAGLFAAVLERSPANRLRHVVQLHLSRDCNRPALARAAAQSLLDELGACSAVHTAEQHSPGATLYLKAAMRQGRSRRSAGRRAGSSKSVEPFLPGLEGESGSLLSRLRLSAYLTLR